MGCCIPSAQGQRDAGGQRGESCSLQQSHPQPPASPSPISTPLTPSPPNFPHSQDSGNGCCCPGCCMPCAVCCTKCCAKCARCCCLPKCCGCPKCPKCCGCPKCPGCGGCGGCLKKSLCFVPRLLCYLPRKLLSCGRLRCLLIVVVVVVLLVVIIAGALLMWLSVDQHHADTVSGDPPVPSVRTPRCPRGGAAAGSEIPPLPTPGPAEPFVDWSGLGRGRGHFLRGQRGRERGHGHLRLQEREWGVLGVTGRGRWHGADPGLASNSCW